MKRTRKRKSGRRVYYPRFSHAKASDTPPRKVLMAELAGKKRITSPASLEARLLRENKLTETLERAVHLPKDPQAEVRAEWQRMIKLEEMDRHMVVHEGLSRVRILFYNRRGTRWWFVEHDLIRKVLRKSIEYGSREQAFACHESDIVLFVE